MTANFIHYFSKYCNSRLGVTSNFQDESLVQKRIKESSMKDVDYHQLASGNNRISKIISYLLSPLKLVLLILKNKYEGLIVLGGDVFSEYYGMGILIDLLAVGIVSQLVPTFLVGHTIGPFTSWRIKFAKLCLSKTKISTRDTWTYLYLIEELGLESKHMQKGADLAFLDLPMQNDLSEIQRVLNMYELTENDYITLIVSGLASHYTSNKTDYIQKWSKIVTSLIQHSTLKSKKIVLLAHVLTGGAGDRKVINELRKELPYEVSNRIIYITNVLLPSEARIILGNGVFTITGRMHGALSTFQMLKPAISLSYSVKYKGVIGENLGMPDLIIESKSDALWGSGEIVELVMEKVEYVLTNYDEIISRVGFGVERNKKMAMTQIEYVAKNLEELMK